MFLFQAALARTALQTMTWRLHLQAVGQLEALAGAQTGADAQAGPDVEVEPCARAGAGVEGLLSMQRRYVGVFETHAVCLSSTVMQALRHVVASLEGRSDTATLLLQDVNT